uniref:Uncharacterized protein n=1 Tax=viral metagenome TaxID=1070528 RepID=A0A6C0KRJ3_9ZZZZ
MLEELIYLVTPSLVGEFGLITYIPPYSVLLLTFKVICPPLLTTTINLPKLYVFWELSEASICNISLFCIIKYVLRLIENSELKLPKYKPGILFEA